MRLGRLTNGDTCEIRMQREMNIWLEMMGFEFADEFRVPEIGRIADFTVLWHGKVVNIEAKTQGSGVLIAQMKDHAIYSDYSFAFIADYGLTPKWFKNSLQKRGFGLIVFNSKSGCITEALEAHRNNNENKELRKKVIQRLKETNKIRASKATGKQENNNQLTL